MCIPNKEICAKFKFCEVFRGDREELQPLPGVGGYTDQVRRGGVSPLPSQKQKRAYPHIPYHLHISSILPPLKKSFHLISFSEKIKNKKGIHIASLCLPVYISLVLYNALQCVLIRFMCSHRGAYIKTPYRRFSRLIDKLYKC